MLEVKELQDFAEYKFKFSVDNFGLGNNVSSLAAVLFGVAEELAEMNMELRKFQDIKDKGFSAKSYREIRDSVLSELGDCLVYLALATHLVQFKEDDYDYICSVSEDGFEVIDLVNYFCLINGDYSSTELTCLINNISRLTLDQLGIGKRVFRGDSDGDILRNAYRQEIVLLSVVASFFGYSWEQIKDYNDKKLNSRQERGALTGNGSDR